MSISIGIALNLQVALRNRAILKILILPHPGAWNIFSFICVTFRRQWHPTPVLLPGKSHGRRSLVESSPWGQEESDTTERLHFTLVPLGFPCSSAGKESACSAGDPGLIPGLGRSPGEGNGNPLQYPCLEKLMDRGGWWAAVHGVAKSRARLRD